VSLDSVFVNVSGATDSVMHRIGTHRYAFLTTNASSTNAQQGTHDDHQRRGDDLGPTERGVPFGVRPSLDSATLSPGTGSGSVVWTVNPDGVPTQVQWPSSVPTRTTSYTARQQTYHLDFGGSGTIDDSLARDYQRDTLGRIATEWRKRGTGYEERNYVYDGLRRLTKVTRFTVSGVHDCHRFDSGWLRTIARPGRR